MPRKPNATRPNAKIAGAFISASSAPIVATHDAAAIRPMIARPSQYAEKLPATRPDRMFSEAPPSRDDDTTSRTWRECVDVNTFTSSGMIAPASVPHVMTVESCHHRSGLSPRFGMVRYDNRYVRATETIEVNHTSCVSGTSKFIFRSDDDTTSRTWRECVDVNTFTSSGMIAPASVPHVMTVESCHHRSGLSPRFGMVRYDNRYVRATETIEVNHTSCVSGTSKFIFTSLAYLAREMALLIIYESPDASTIMMRIRKIQTSSVDWIAGSVTASTMKVMSATPVTP